MVVYVVRLRRRGVRLSREEAMLAAPVRGVLQFSRSRPGWHRDRLLAGVRLPGSEQWALPPLDHARVTRIDQRGMLIVGIEQEAAFSNRLESFRQAWWVRVLGARIAD